jgi:hypothetical protein
MEFETREKFKTELRSFFGLTILNLVIGALMLALGISLAVTRLLGMVDAAQIDPLSVLMLGLGAVAIAAGFYWIIQIAEIMEGIDDVKTAYDTLQNGSQEQAAGLIIKMLAHYRSNKTTTSRMIVLGRIGGVLFLIAGGLGMIEAGASIFSSGLMAENLSQLFGGLVAFGVGIAGMLISRYFSMYSKVWDARLEQSARIENALELQLEAK